MERRLLRILFVRVLLIALPIVAWFIWADIARRRGKPMGRAPWAWLLAAGLVLAALSLLIGGLMAPSIGPDSTYVPVQTTPSGKVIPGAP